MSQQDSATRTQVLIVGAGPTGLMLASLLHRQGISFRIFDKSSGPAKESRALGIQARSLELFHNLGLVDEFLAAGVRAMGVTIYVDGIKRAEVEMTDMSRPDTPYPYIFLLSQAETERILLKDLKSKGVEIERETSLAGFEQTNDGVHAVIESPRGRERIEADFIIGCDGAHSTVRKTLGLAFEGGSYASEFVMADARVKWDLPLDRLIAFVNPGSLGVLFPLQHSRLSRVLSIRQLEAGESEPATQATTSAPATLEEIERAFNLASHQNAKLVDPEWVTKFHVHHRSVRQMRVKRAFLAGDAGHIHSPVGAQGMNTGLQDAANLAWKLALVLKGGASESLLKTYHSERWPIAQRLLGFTDRAFSLLTTKNETLIAIRSFAMPLATKVLMAFPAGRRRIFRFISQLAIRYHESMAAREQLSAAASERFRRTLPAGHRAPNARIDGDRQLFDEMKGYGFRFLVFSEEALASDERAKVQATLSEMDVPGARHASFIWISREQAREAFERYGVDREAAFLIRPDWYVGYRTDEIPL